MPPPDSDPRPRRRFTPAHLVVAGLVVLTGPFAVEPLWDAATGDAVPFARLVHPLPYLVGAPLFGVWDTLSLLTLSQHYAVLVTLVALWVGSRVAAPSKPWPFAARAAREVGLSVAALVGLLAFYAAGMLLPRPMVGIEIAETDLVTIDFHSHTHFSHDGWSLFTPERNRAWHEAGGFDVAYVTDHYTWRGFDESDRTNPTRVGERTAMLIGAEIRIHLRPTNVLGDRERYQFALDTDSTYMEPDSLRARYARDRRPPTLLYTMPGGLEWVVPFTEDEPSGVIAIELNDASPRGLEQVKRERAQILALADSANLAVIGAANLHGWGRTVASWSVMELPGWQGMTPEHIGEVIEADLHGKRRRAVTVVERRMPYHAGSPLAVVLTLPRVALEHFRMLGAGERASWLLWIGVLAGAGAVYRRHVSPRRRPGTRRASSPTP